MWASERVRPHVSTTMKISRCVLDVTRTISLHRQSRPPPPRSTSESARALERDSGACSPRPMAGGPWRMVSSILRGGNGGGLDCGRTPIQVVHRTGSPSLSHRQNHHSGHLLP